MPTWSMSKYPRGSPLSTSVNSSLAVADFPTEGGPYSHHTRPAAALTCDILVGPLGRLHALFGARRLLPPPGDEPRTGHRAGSLSN